MQIHCAQIVDEPENAPTLLLAASEAELLQKLKACGDLQWLDGLEDCDSLDAVCELYSEQHEEMYAGIFYEVQEL